MAEMIDNITSFRMQVAAGMVASITTGVGIVLLNKALYVNHNFTFMVTLTGWHLAGSVKCQA